VTDQSFARDRPIAEAIGRRLACSIERR